MVVGMVSMDIICCMKEGGILAEKYPTRMLGSLMLAQVMWFWNSEMY